MGGPTDSGPGSDPVSTFDITHRLQAGDGGGWSQSQVAGLSSGDAAAWISKQASEALDLGFKDGLAADPAGPTGAASASDSSASSASTPPFEVASPDLGDS